MARKQILSRRLFHHAGISISRIPYVSVRGAMGREIYLGRGVGAGIAKVNEAYSAHYLKQISAL